MSITCEALGEKILVADDSSRIRSRLTELLAAHRFQVVTASSGEEVVERTAQQRPDLIVMDVALPGMDGFDTCHALQQDPRTREIPVIFLAARAAETDRVRGLRLGALDYLTKGGELEELGPKIRTHFTTLRARTANSVRLRSLEAEVVGARRMQAAQLPSSMPRLPGLDLDGRVRRAAGLGGDYFDVLSQGEEMLAWIGEVTPRGVPGALVMVMARTWLQEHPLGCRSCDSVLEELTPMLQAEVDPVSRIHLGLLEWRAATGAVRYCRSGRSQLMHFHAADGRVSRLEDDQLAVDVQLAPGDTLLMHTSGAVTVRNRKRQTFGYARLEAAFAARACASSAAIVVDGILDELQAFRGRAEQTDDITLLCISADG